MRMRRLRLFGLRFNEIVGISLILLVIGALAYGNFQTAERRRRDQSRKAQVAHVANMLEKYVEDFGSYPLASREGQIVACGEDSDALEACRWGWDPLADVSDPSYPPYIEQLPADPQHGKGVRYMYFSVGTRFQIYASLEGGADEDEYDPSIEVLGIMCGTRACNFGKANGRTPLDKTIKEYETELKSGNLK